MRYIDPCAGGRKGRRAEGPKETTFELSPGQNCSRFSTSHEGYLPRLQPDLLEGFDNARSWQLSVAYEFSDDVRSSSNYLFCFLTANPTSAKFPLTSPMPSSHASLYASSGDLPSLLSRTHLKEALVASIEVSSMSRNWRSETFGSSDRRSLEICGTIKSLPRSSSSTRPLPKHHIEPSYARACVSQYL